MSNSEGFENNAVAAIGGDSFVVFATNTETPTALAYLALRNIAYKKASGAYVMRDTGETVSEVCYIVNARGWDRVKPLIEGIMEGDKPQESVLILGPRATRDGFRPAVLQFIDGRPSEFLGYLVNVSEKVARASGQWTEDDQGFWIATHDPERAIEESNPAE